MSARDEELESSFRWQADICRAMSAPFTAALLDACAESYKARGSIHDLVKDWEGEPRAGALGLRVIGAVQAAARATGTGELAALFSAPPSEPQNLRRLIEDAATENLPLFKDFARRAVQTNEVLRAAALLGGFLEIAKQTSLPLELFEVGASGGLLLGWDRYRYEFGAFAWGKEGGLRLKAEWKGEQPDWPAKVDVANRRGCDINPIDYDDPEAVLRASSYFWAEQDERRERFLAAVAATRGLGITVDKANAGDWLSERLTARTPGRAAVVYHSVMIQYLSEADRSAMEAAIAAAAERATQETPFARLRFEPDPVDVLRFAVDLTLWPGGKKLRLAYAHPHAAWVEWLGA
ncbi:MAG: DUF2332 family protein [Parvularculaceae bacterium]